MKNEESLRKSTQAALLRARATVSELEQQLGFLHSCQVGFAGENPMNRMPKIRALLGEVTQRIHEFNAYFNALHTE